ncbi:MAG: hypothetical protein U5M51_02385 [Emticicia sp.]|nr:hypothetical protein [Emticicia sp.]
MSKLDRPMPSVSLAGDTDGTEILTPHHIPNDSYMKNYLKLPGYTREKGFCMTMEHDNSFSYKVARHGFTETYKKGVDYSNLTVTQVLQRQCQEYLEICKMDGFSKDELEKIKKELQYLANDTHNKWPTIFQKITIKD